MKPIDVLSVAFAAFVAGYAAGGALQKHRDDKAAIQSQVWDLKGQVAHLVRLGQLAAAEIRVPEGEPAC
jgi:hypothetical protein